MSNQPEKMSDHDALIKLSIEVNNLCDLVHELREDVKKQTNMCACRFKECTRFFVPNRVFYTALLLVVAGITTLATVAYQNRQDVAVHYKEVEKQLALKADKKTVDDFSSLKLNLNNHEK